MMENYIENEEVELENLKTRLSKLKGKWFKLESAKSEIEFLEFYINKKQELIKSLLARVKY